MVPCDVLVPRAKGTFVSPDGGVAQLGATVTATVTAVTTLASPTLSSAHLTARFMPSSQPRSPAGLDGDPPVEDDGRNGTGTHGGELVPAPGRAVEGSGPSSEAVTVPPSMQQRAERNDYSDSPHADPPPAPPHGGPVPGIPSGRRARRGGYSPTLPALPAVEGNINNALLFFAAICI